MGNGHSELMCDDLGMGMLKHGHLFLSLMISCMHLQWDLLTIFWWFWGVLPPLLANDIYTGCLPMLLFEEYIQVSVGDIPTVPSNGIYFDSTCFSFRSWDLWVDWVRLMQCLCSIFVSGQMILDIKQSLPEVLFYFTVINITLAKSCSFPRMVTSFAILSLLLQWRILLCVLWSVFCISIIKLLKAEFQFGKLCL